MKTLRMIALAVVAFSFCGAAAAANSMTDFLVRNVWKMERQTGLGRVTTIWMFLDDGTGISYQKATRGRDIDTYNHRFTYRIEKGQVIVQEEIEEQWEGYFGVTRWRLNNNQLVSDTKFRRETIAFSPVNL